jgi:tetratricopeptide (TPR) repeat protein
VGATVMDQVDRLRAALADRYTLDREIGRGGMAYVYRAHDRQHDRDVAIKVLKPELASAIGTERFLREIHFEATLQHPHILPLYDSGSAEGQLYYVMPYVEGESLRQRIERERQLPLEDAVKIAREVADALGHAHSHNCVHRDIKPANIMLSGYSQQGQSAAWHAVVTDFGMARVISAAAGEQLTTTGIVVGTPEYMSPEQASGDQGVDGRSDVYSLGCVVYEMLAGEPPFVGRTAQAILARHRQDTPTPIKVLRPRLPVAVGRAVELALAKVPAERFATAQAFADALVQITAPGPRGPSGAKRVRWRLVAALIAAIVVVGVVAFMAKERLSGSLPASADIAVAIVPFDQPATVAQQHPGTHLLFTEALGWLPGVRAVDGTPLLGSSPSWRALSLGDLLRGAHRLGAKYLVIGSVMPRAKGSQVSVDLYAVENGEHVAHGADSAQGLVLDGPVGRLALQSVSALAGREGLRLGPRRVVFTATTSAVTVGQLLRAQSRSLLGDKDGAAAALRAALAADSNCGLAYHRLSVAEWWRDDDPAALAAVDAGLRRRDKLAQRWLDLLQAQRYFALGYGDSAIAAFQDAVLNDNTDVDAWYGLGEALLHFGAFAGHSPLDARPALDRVAALDSTFGPVYDDLFGLALQAGDRRGAERYLQRLPKDAWRSMLEAVVTLYFGPARERAAALARLRTADRSAISQVVIDAVHGGHNLGLADTVAGYLLGSDRTPDDRRRGSEYRLVILAAQGRWPDAVQAWKSAAGDQPFDAWLIQAELAGYPARDLATPMYAWARSLLAAGRIPDFRRPVWDESRQLRQAFDALAQRAALQGDSVDVRDLLRRIDRAAAPDSSDPSPGALRASLRARLALLAADTVGAIGLLQQAVSRIPEVWTANFPLTALAGQRFLLSELLAARGDSAGARRWRASFSNSWAVVDVLYLARMGLVGGPRAK